VDDNRWNIKRLLVTDNGFQETNKMLNQVLLEIETAQSALNLGDLSRKLGIERGALDGMIQFWVRKGRLVDDDAVEIAVGAVCSSSVCGSSCTGPANCAFVAKMPKTYSISQEDIE
jgi:hypothetical protein